MKKSALQTLFENLRRIPPALFLILSLLLTAAATFFAHQRTEIDQHARFDRLSRRLTSSIEVRMQVYIDALLHTRSFFLSSEHISRTEFKDFISGLELRTRYPGFQGIGFTRRILPDELEDHLQSVRSSGFTNYTVWPPGQREEYFSILFLEPFDERNQRAFGYDMSTEPTRRAAMEQARDTGQPAMTGKVTLVQESGVENQAGFLIYVPLYKKGVPVTTVEERRAALEGFVYSPFRSGDLFGEILKRENQNARLIALEVFDGASVDERSKLFGFSIDQDEVTSVPRSQEMAIQVGNHGWRIRVSALKDFEAPTRNAHWYVLLAGLLISGLIYFISLLVVRSNLALQESENQLRLVTDTLPVLVGYIDRDERYLFCNQTYLEWFGRAPEEIEGKTISEVVGETAYLNNRSRVLEALSGKPVSFVSEWEHAKKGKRIVRRDYLPDIRRNKEVAGIVVLGTDITDERRSQSILEEERRIVETVSEVGLSLRAELDLDELVQNITDAATRLVNARFGAFFYDVKDSRGEAHELVQVSGMSKEAFEKFPLSKRTRRLDSAVSKEKIVRFDDLNAHETFEQSLVSDVSPQEHLMVRSYMAVPVVSRSGHTIGELIFGHPEPGIFTERAEKIVAGVAAQAAVAFDNARLYAEAQAINRVKDEFLATLSHELRTPLNVILGHAEILKTEAPPLGEDLDVSIDAIFRNAKVQNQIISDLLDISAIITGKIAFHPVRVHMGEVIKAAADSIRFAAEARGVLLDVQDRAPGCTILGDPTRLQQIVWNLLSNAVKFTPRGGRISIASDNSRSKCTIEVADTGIGIEPSFLPYVFDRFRQEDSSQTRRYGGLGLGLSIVRQLVELHGGSIQVDSEGKERGSRFTITFPVAAAQVDLLDEHDGPSPSTAAGPEAGSAGEPKGALDPVRLSGINVLIVDDEADARDLVGRVLAKAGAKVRAVSSAEEALKAFDQENPSVIVSDIGMPNEDGLSLIRRIREREARTGDFTPAVALTAYARSEERKRALGAGFQAHLAKPVEARSLIENVLRVLDV